MFVKKPLSSRYFTYAVIAILYIPIAILIINSFNASRFGGSWNGFTFAWYQKLLHEPAIWQALINSLIVATYSSLVATTIGVSAALAMYRFHSLLQRFHMVLLLAPLFMPDILMGISLLLLFVSFHFKLSLFTVFLAHTTFSISYVAMTVKARLDSFDPSMEEAARDLGATSWQVFWKVLFPNLIPAIAASGLLAFTLSLDDFVITFFVVGPGATTLPVYVYSMMKFGSPPLINALSTVLLLFTATITIISSKLTKDVLT